MSKKTVLTVMLIAVMVAFLLVVHFYIQTNENWINTFEDKISPLKIATPQHPTPTPTEQSSSNSTGSYHTVNLNMNFVFQGGLTREYFSLQTFNNFNLWSYIGLDYDNFIHTLNTMNDGVFAIIVLLAIIIPARLFIINKKRTLIVRKPAAYLISPFSVLLE